MTGIPFQLELTRPWLLAGLVVLPFLVYYFHRSLVDFTRRQLAGSLAIRSLVVILLALALSGLTLMLPTDRQFVVFVVDASLSIDDQSRDKAARYIEQARQHTGNNDVAFLSFAEEPGRVEAEFQRDSLKPQEEKAKGTNLAAAIEVATAAIPPFYVPHVVLLTDGNQTDGDVLATALAAGVPISTVPLAVRADPEVQVSGVEVPAQVRQGEPFYVEVVIDSNHDDEGTVEIFRGPHKVESSRQKISKGENRFRFRQTAEEERLVEFAARIEGFDDALLDNNTAAGLVFTSGKPRVLLIDSDPKTTRHFTWSMQEQNIQIDVRPPEGTPSTLSGLQNYELLILSNVPATALSMRQMDVIRTYVQDLGGGLIMLGGDQSFGLGGYYKTTLEEILPVRSDFEKEKEKPSLGMVLIVDKSGSMGGMKIELAKDAARSAVELLGPRDQIGVIAFDGAAYWVSEVHSAADKHYIIDRISTIEASGGTNIYPAMVDGYEALTAAVAKLKHVILLTDGHSSPGDFEGITAQMAAARMTVSTVAVGSGADQPLLENIARIGNGRYYFCDDPQSVPQIFAKETITASKSAINERPFVPQVVQPTQVLSNLDLSAAPFLLGYVVTRPKPTSEFILASESGEPLLVWWRYGLGMTVAFTSDAKARWAAEWLTWPDFSPFWAQVVRHAMRKSDAKGVFVQVHRRGRKVKVVLDAVDPSGQYLNQAKTNLMLIDPDLGSRQLPMAQVAPGRYSSQFETARDGTYHLELSQEHQGQVAFRQTRGLVVGYADELRLRPTNEELLQETATASGGTYDPAPEAVFDAKGRTTMRAEPLWPYLLMAAAALFLLDVALRRIDFSLFFSRRPRPG
ncbi:MAG: VWA domain-containing protein [Planctomycetota bacterium]|jgi:Mg-chelatase subunit ChlD